MRCILLIILLPSFVCFSQKKKDIQPTFYLDMKKVDLKKVYLHSSSIKNIEIVKEGNGNVFIYLRNNVSIQPLNTFDYKNISALKQKLFIIDTKVILKPSEVLIDPSVIKDVSFIKSKTIEGLPPTFSIVKITTHNALNKKKKIQF